MSNKRSFVCLKIRNKPRKIELLERVKVEIVFMKHFAYNQNVFRI